MQHTGRTIAKNASVMMASQMVTWILSLVITIILPRYLGAEAIGQLRLASSIWALVAIVAAFGMDSFLIKEIAQSPNETGRLLSTSLILRLAIFLVGSLVVAAYLQVVGYSARTILIVTIIGFSSLIGQIAFPIDASLRGLERMEFTSMAGVISAALLTAMRLLLLLLKQDVVAIAAVAIFAAVVNLAILYFSLRRLQPLRFTFQWGFAKTVLSSSLPFFLVGVGIVVYHEIDVLVLSWLLTEQSIGWYGVVDTLFGSMLFVPNIIMSVLFPTLSRLVISDRAAFVGLARKVFEWMAVVSVPLGLGMMIIANQVIALLFGAEFVNSGPILAVRSIVLIMTYANMILGLTLIVSSKQKRWAMVILTVSLLTIPLDYLFIPLCERLFANGAIGGAVSYLVTDSIQLVAGLVLLPRGILNRSTAWLVTRVLAAGGLMVAVTWAWRNAFLMIPILIAMVVYLGAILLFRVLKQEDFAALKKVQSYIIRRFWKHAPV